MTALRPTTAGDQAAMLALYPAMFPGEDLRPLVTSLLNGDAPPLSLGAFEGADPVGHVLFTPFEHPGGGKGALLGPLGVAPNRQRGGLGSALIRDGLARLTSARVDQVFVLGDPAYYGRFGFAPEADVGTPYPLPDEWRDAWQSLRLEGGTPLAPGPCTLPAPWMDPALWAP